MILCWQRHHVLIYLNIKEESDRREGKGRRCRCRTKIWQQDDLKKWTIRRTDIWQNGCFGNVDDHRVHITPNHQPPKMDVLLKTILHIILVAKKAIVAFMYDFSSDILVFTSPKQQQRSLPSLLSDSSSIYLSNPNKIKLIFADLAPGRAGQWWVSPWYCWAPRYHSQGSGHSPACSLKYYHTVTLIIVTSLPLSGLRSHPSL